MNNDMEKRFERTYMKVCVIGNLTKDEAMQKANHERFKTDPFMVGDMSRIENEVVKSDVRVFTFVEVYFINNIFSKKYIRHLFCKLRAAALRYIGISPIVVITVTDTGFILVDGASEIS